MRGLTLLILSACALICTEAFGMYRYGPLDLIESNDPTKFNRKVKSGNGFDLSHVSAYPKGMYLLQDLVKYLDAVGRRK